MSVGSSAPLPILVGPERRKLRGPTPIAMLPLTEVDWDGFVGAGPGAAAAGESQGEGEWTWHNPGLIQSVEMLGAAMARKGAGEKLDVRYVFSLPLLVVVEGRVVVLTRPRYNSCVLSLIEGFYRLTRTLCETNSELKELKETRERELEQFRDMAEDWIGTSEGFKAEIKRLEIALAKESNQGMATVALARQGSLIDRSGSRRLRDNIEQLTARPIGTYTTMCELREGEDAPLMASCRYYPSSARTAGQSAFNGDCGSRGKPSSKCHAVKLRTNSQRQHPARGPADPRPTA